MQNNHNVNLQLVLCPVRQPDKKYKDLYDKIYKCWNLVWEEAYTAAHYKKKSDDLKSDAFTRQDYAAAFFYEGECVAFILFRHIDMSLLSSQDDSFFTQWSEIHRKALSKIGNHFLITGNLGVLPTFRNKNLGVSLKDLMVGIVAEITLQSNADATIATPRRDRNVHGTSYNWGAIPIAQDVAWGCGIQIDLVAFCKDQVAQKRAQLKRPLLDELWLNKIVVGESNFESVDQLKDTLPHTLQNEKANKKTG